MQVFHRLEDLSAVIPSAAVVIGNFDGVHLGHQALLSQMFAEARTLGVPSCVLTFFPHPVELLRPEKKRERLSTAAEKLALFEGMGVDFVLVAPFDKDLASLSPDAFFQKFLASGIKAKSVTVGFDFRFGKDRAGDTEVLKQICTSYQIALNVVPPFVKEGEKISSSAIRKVLRDGDVAVAAKSLGRPYSITGIVSHGDNRGEAIGFPTANVRYPEDKLLPKDGVYVTRAVWQKQVFSSVTNVGVRPTFHKEDDPRTVEVHLIDFKARLYDEIVKVEFLQRIRDEKKFGSVKELTDQIQRDVQYTRDLFRASV